MASAFAAQVGIDLYPWQEAVLDDWLAVDADAPAGAGTAPLLAHVNCILEVPRRNGKNYLLLARELFGAMVRGEDVLHTAHRYPTVKEMFNDLCAITGDRPDDPRAACPAVNREVRAVWRSPGRMAVSFRNGGLIAFATRTNSGNRGTGHDLVVVDEAQEYTEVQQQAMDSVNDGAPLGSPQTIYTGTPPEDGGVADVFLRIRDDAIERPDRYTCLHEWSVDGPRDNMDEDAWYLTNPSLGYHIQRRTILAKAAKMSKEGFNRERLGHWPQSSRPNPISAKKWRECIVTEAPRGRMAYGVKFSPDGATCAVAGAIRPDEGPVFLNLFACRPGAGSTTDVCEWLMARVRTADAIAVDGKQGAPTLVAKLKASKVPRGVLLEPGPSGMADAASMLVAALGNGDVTHPDSELLEASATGCVRRKIGKEGAWSFDSTSEADATAIEAVALAHWASANAKRDARKKARVW